LNIGGVELFAHELREGFQPGWGDGRLGAGLNDQTIESGLRHLPLLLQRLDPLLEVAVEVNNALLNRPVEALESIVAAGADASSSGPLAFSYSSGPPTNRLPLGPVPLTCRTVSSAISMKCGRLACSV
jgi:hypothetical protein